MKPMEIKVFIAMILTVATAILLTGYWAMEPHRIKVDTEEMRAEAIKKGKALYTTHCARCHGEEGGPQRGIRALNSKNYLAKVHDSVLYNIIERGIPGTGMAALGEKEGGPLNPDQVNSLVAFIRGWEKTAPALPEEPSPKEKPFFIQEGASFVGSESCIECHESMNKKHIDAWRKSPMAQKAYALIQNEKDQTKCTSCHATGYNPETKAYKEKNVACEACHGPGERYVEMMMGAEAVEGGKIAKENALKSCPRCHKPHISKEEHIELARKGQLPYP
jgi:mono/diheme cytochrome c family protein/Zn finger protein HypA/HybF involved in hydrogenase expression